MESHEKEQNRSKIALSSSSPLFVTPTPTTLLFERRLHRLYHPILLLQTCTITDRLLGVILSSFEADLDSRIAFSDAWKELRREQRELLRVLDEEEWNQVAAAKRLGRHRNMIRLWLEEIRQVLKRQALP